LLNGEKPQKLDFTLIRWYLLARNEICFVKRETDFIVKRFEEKTKLDEVGLLGPLNLSVGLQPIIQSTGKYCVKITENLRNTSQTTNEI